jgi:hypothetical protein
MEERNVARLEPSDPAKIGSLYGFNDVVEDSKQSDEITQWVYASLEEGRNEREVCWFGNHQAKSACL